MSIKEGRETDRNLEERRGAMVVVVIASGDAREHPRFPAKSVNARTLFNFRVARGLPFEKEFFFSY